LSDTRPRGRNSSTVSGIARHGRLKKAGPLGTVLGIIGTVVAVLVVSSLGDPGDPARVLAHRGAVAPGELVTLADLDLCRTEPILEKETA